MIRHVYSTEDPTHCANCGMPKRTAWTEIDTTKTPCLGHQPHLESQLRRVRERMRRDGFVPSWASLKAEQQGAE
jgi:hypothetical protein